MSCKRNPNTLDRDVAVLDARIEVLKQRDDDLRRMSEDINRRRMSVLADIAELEAQKKDMEDKRFPVHWLPPELLVEIFTMCCDEREQDRSFKDGDLCHQMPVVLSHVCHRWRAVTILTSNLWGFICCRDAKQSAKPISIFLERSNNSPLDIVYLSSFKGREFSSSENTDVTNFLKYLEPHIPRCRSATFKCRNALGIDTVTRFFKKAPFLCLESLDLSIAERNPSFQQAPSLLETSKLNETRAATQALDSESSLKHLCLQQVPLFSLQSHHFTGLRSLELCFPRRNVVDFQTYYALKVTSLCRVLSLTPRLEDLVLLNTVPIYDAIVRNSPTHTGNIPGPPGSSRVIDPVDLLCLRRIEWSFPDYAYTHRLFHFFTVPTLEKLEISFDVPVARNPLLRRQDLDDLAMANAPAVCFPSLKELSVHCGDIDALSYLLRRLMFPNLEKAELVNIDVRTYDSGSLPTLPRVESIFRDPRLPLLGHLTISHYNLEMDNTRSMLSYMPALTDLSLDTCTGSEVVLACLSEVSTVVSGTFSLNDTSTLRPGVKLCSKLDSLSFWSCEDLFDDSLVQVLMIRNQCKMGRGMGEESNIAVLVEGRKIRPLPKIRRQMTSSLPSADPDSHILARMNLEDALRPSRVTSVHIEGCVNFTAERARSLKELGVEHVVWHP